MRLVLLVSRDQFRVAYESMISASVWGVCVDDYGLLFTQSEIWYDVGWLSGCCADEPLPKNVGAS